MDRTALLVQGRKRCLTEKCCARSAWARAVRTTLRWLLPCALVVGTGCSRGPADSVEPDVAAVPLRPAHYEHGKAFDSGVLPKLIRLPAVAEPWLEDAADGQDTPPPFEPPQNTSPLPMSNRQNASESQPLRVMREGPATARPYSGFSDIDVSADPSPEVNFPPAKRDSYPRDDAARPPISVGPARVRPTYSQPAPEESAVAPLLVRLPPVESEQPVEQQPPLGDDASTSAPSIVRLPPVPLDLVVPAPAAEPFEPKIFALPDVDAEPAPPLESAGPLRPDPDMAAERLPVELEPIGPLTPPAPDPRSNPVVPFVEQQPTPTPPAPRNAQMVVIADEAGRQAQRGFVLAGRGAFYSAHAEFVRSLRTIAQALDLQSGSSRHTQALAAGLTALEEAEDFRAAAEARKAADLVAIIAAHRTPVLKDNAGVAQCTSVAAMQRYYTFAQEQLAAAVGNEPVGSWALYGLGKLHTALHAGGTSPVAEAPKAITLHQAALLVDMRNHLAANELGVLLARCGQYQAAHDVLVHSVRLYPQHAAWHNLAVVCERLGAGQQAADARQRASQLQPAASPQHPVEWVDPQTFAQSRTPWEGTAARRSDRR